MSATRILAIARLTVRDACRSRLLLAVGLLLACGVVAIPLIIKGDGTLGGRVHVALLYALRYAGTVLGIATLWAACAGAANDIRNARLDGVLAKPVYRAEIWLGKWLAIVGLNALLLAVAGGLIYGSVRWIVRPAAAAANDRSIIASQVLVARQALTPWVAAAGGRTTPSAPTGTDTAKPGPDILPVPPGAAALWTFRLPQTSRPLQPLTVTLRFASSRPEGLPVDGIWFIGALDATNRRPIPHTLYPGRPNRLVVPARAVAADGTLTLELHNAETVHLTTLVIAKADGIRLLVPCGSFAGNYVRALIILFCRLTLLAALGVTMGSLLSLPVAMFVASACLVVLALGGYIDTVVTTGQFYTPHEGPAPVETAADALIKGLYRTVDRVTRPIQGLDPLPNLADGLLVPWSAVARACGLLLVLYGGLVAALGMGLFRRRELGLASQR